jgi:hypothetical protein
VRSRPPLRVIPQSRTESKIVVLIPCLKEEKTIGKIEGGFSLQLPEAEVLAFDNGSADHTFEEDDTAGVAVWTERQRGRGACSPIYSRARIPENKVLSADRL